MMAALSGYGNVARPASPRMRSPVSMSLPPIQLTMMGFSASVVYGMISRAVLVGSVMAWGVRMTSRPSLSGSWAMMSRAAA